MSRGSVAEECLACAHASLRDWFVKKTTTGEYPISRCSSCGSAFVYPRPSSEAVEAIYQCDQLMEQDGKDAPGRLRAVLADEARYPVSRFYAERALKLCWRMARGRRLLDVGAGTGLFSAAALELGFEVRALEPSPMQREVFAELNGFEPDPSFCDLDSARAHAGEFDVVLMSQVLEHVAVLDEAVVAVNTLLAVGGVAAIAVPLFRSAVSVVQGKRDMFMMPPRHLSCFTSAGLTALFERFGFDLVHTETWSRVDPARIRRRIGIPLLWRPVVWLLHASLRVADVLGKGLFLFSYFVKRRSVARHSDVQADARALSRQR